ncbi:serine hydrolase domain-containing protein [Streptomyces sp. NPDC047108]|uniref:serine hydrolase domain-containing protein n=1 Tax=Streptomyces sp. NPDC047108 TaxID=3155025 RepID=UPI0033D1B49F
MGAVLVAAVVGTAWAAPVMASTAADAGRKQSGGGHDAAQAAMDANVQAGVPGVLGRAQDARGSWSGSSGVADLKTDRPRRAEDRFRIGSITKTFIATVVLQLEKEKKLGLDDTVDSWLPGVVEGHGHDGRAVTVRQLLNHTSGIYNYTEDPAFQKKYLTEGFLEHRYDTLTPKQLVGVAMRHKPLFEPGTDWTYSNTNYVLAGMIVEKASGRSYASEIERRIIRPLGLRATTVPGTKAAMPGPHGRAYGKLDTAPDAKIHDVTELNPSWGGAAGEMISSAGDLNRFHRALLGGKLLPEGQLKKMLTTVPTGGEEPFARYGLGISPSKLSCGKEVWGHTGGIHGSISVAGVTRDGRHSAAFNLNGDWVGDVLLPMEGEFCGTLPEKPEKGAAKTLRKPWQPVTAGVRASDAR